MSKYDALWRYLQTSGQTQLTLTFDEEKAQTVSSEGQKLPGYGTGKSWQEFGR